MKTVSQLDADGYYVSTTIAQRSPLEPGVFLIPGGAVDAYPPVVPQGKRARWANGWVFEDIPAPESDPAPTLDQIRADKISEIDAARDAALEAGFLFGGVRYDCDDLSVQRITGAAVLGIMAIGAHKLSTKSIGKDKLLWGIFGVLAAVTIITQSEIAWLFIAAGLLVWVIRCKPSFGNKAMGLGLLPPVDAAQLAPVVLDPALLTQIGLFFAKAGTFVFGSGLAIVPFLYAGTVTEHHWLTDRQFVDAVAVAMITPGPVVITTGFIGYLVAGFPGAAMAAAATSKPPVRPWSIAFDAASLTATTTSHRSASSRWICSSHARRELRSRRRAVASLG